MSPWQYSCVSLQIMARQEDAPLRLVNGDAPRKLLCKRIVLEKIFLLRKNNNRHHQFSEYRVSTIRNGLRLLVFTGRKKM